jgi:hypothetical protein
VQSYLNSANAESYPQVGSYIGTHGTQYRLTDVIDFRPCRKNAQSSYVWEYQGGSGSINSFGGDDGILIPSALNNFYGTYSYYLARKDKLILTKDRQFKIISGTSSINPAFPTEPDGSMLIANLSLDPYTAYVPGENPPGQVANLSINKVIHKRWAKSDITNLEARVNNLEYYTSLSLLEQSAQAAQVPDVNGLNRFKNGILVDDFSSYSTADTTNPDFGAKINIVKNKLGPIALVNNFQLHNPIVLSSLATTTKLNTYQINSINGGQTNIFTLPYTTANVIVQSLASSTISVNPFNVVVQQGIQNLNPPMDNWVDNTQAPAILVTDPSLQVYQQSNGINYTNMGNWQTIPGTVTSTSSQTEYLNHGQFNGPYGSTVGYASTVTNTYGSQLQNITASGYSSLPAGTSINNGYLTNIAILPYIRPQQIVVKSKGLLVNSNVSCWFDGVNVSRYMSKPNFIELNNVNYTNGGFNENDIVGFYIASAGQFYPIARVVSVYNYPDTTSCRLYVSTIVNAANTVGSTVLQNATFDSNGTYQASGNTAQGTLASSAIISLNQSDIIGGVGGGYANVLNSSVVTQYYMMPPVGGYSSFLNQYGIWGDQNNSTSYNVTFPVPLTTSGTYTITLASSGTVSVSANGTTIATSSSTNATACTYSIAGQVNPYNLSIASSSSGSTTSGVAVTITDPNGNLVFDTVHPLAYVNGVSTGSGITTESVLPLGGAWFTGVTKLKLGPTASSNTNFYVGSTITVTSKYVYQVNQSATYVAPPPAPSGGSGGGGGKIICTKLYQLGLMDEEIYKADQEFGELLRQNDPSAYYGYIRWATIVVDWMSGQGPQCMFWIKDDVKRAEIQSKLATKWAHRIATPWAEHMAYLMGKRDKDNFAGKIIMNIGKPISKLVNLLPKKNKEAGIATGYGMWILFAFLYAVSKVFGNKSFPKTINN